MLGVYKITDLRYENKVFEKKGKKYYFIDFKGETKLEVEDGWTIVRGFHSGKVNSN